MTLPRTLSPEMLAAEWGCSPKRIQRKRTRGWKMPDGVVYVGRGSRWGNPFRVGKIVCYGHPDGEACDCQDYFGCTSAEEAVQKFREWRADIAAEHKRRGTDFVESWLAPLRGKDLACWCPLVDAEGNPTPCHADVLLELANKP